MPLNPDPDPLPRSELIRVYGFSCNPNDVPGALDGATNLDPASGDFLFPSQQALEKRRVVVCTLATASKVGGREREGVGGCLCVCACACACEWLSLLCSFGDCACLIPF